MESEETLGGIPPWFKKFLLPIGLGLFGTVFLGFGAISMISSGSEDKNVIFEAANEDKKVLSVQNENEEELMIDVSGAVMKPGVYSLKKSSRIKDAIFEAGGITEDANNEFISKKLNLAARLNDGMKIYIPFVNEDIASDLSGSNNQGLIDINSASSELLDSLPGVGKVTAEKIIDARPFREVSDLLSKKVVSGSVFEKIKEKVTIN